MLSNEQQQVEQWLDNIVIGLNLCPFATKPRRNNQIRFKVSQALTNEVLIADLYEELSLLAQTEATKVETTLIIVPNMLADFEDANQFLDIADNLLVEFNWEGIFQIASFHPDYYFESTQPEDAENYTNRAPYPIFHLLRENSLTAALQNMSSPDEVYERNINTMNHLSADQIKTLFSYLL